MRMGLGPCQALPHVSKSKRCRMDALHYGSEPDMYLSYRMIHMFQSLRHCVAEHLSARNSRGVAICKHAYKLLQQVTPSMGHLHAVRTRSRWATWDWMLAANVLAWASTSRLQPWSCLCAYMHNMYTSLVAVITQLALDDTGQGSGSFKLLGWRLPYLIAHAFHLHHEKCPPFHLLCS